MSRPRQQAALAVDAFCRVFGRRHVVRAARFALNRARLDLPNQATINGEYALQRWVLATIPAAEPVTVFDVGANVGTWSLALLRQAGTGGHAHNLVLHAFEPASSSHATLRERLPDSVRVNRLAVSADSGRKLLYVVGPGAGRNSLHESDIERDDPVHTEQVDSTTVDDYARHNGIDRIHLMKIDTEGHDFSVLAGAAQSLRDRTISLVQFEYNHRWVHARHFLKDVFDFVEPLGYRVGKLTPGGMEMYPGWDPELENFIEGNYLACTEEMADRLPQVRWWKAR